MAFTAIAAHKLRSSLTLSGVLVGVFSILGVMTAMRVLQDDIRYHLSQLGSHTFLVQRWPALMLGGDHDFKKYRERQRLTYDQARKAMERITLARNVGVEVTLWYGEVQGHYGSTAPTAILYGETPGSFSARNWTVAEGRLITDADVDKARDVAVLGAGLAKTVFPHSDPLGDQIKINGFNYTVIGVLERKGSAMREDQDNLAIIPITTGLDHAGSRRRDVSLLIQAPDQLSYEDTVDEVRGVLRVLRKVRPGEEDSFEIISNDSLIREFDNFTRAVRIGVGVVSSIALLAAGIGIMNIMLVSVTERTREIGIRRAVGAKKRHILSQFIMEAVALCQVGGVVGVLLGILAGNALAWLIKVPPAIPVDWIILGFVICSAVGVIFGTYPAWRAANLDPVDSLRYE